MRVWTVLFSLFAAAGLLAACNAYQPPVGVPGAAPQSVSRDAGYTSLYSFKGPPDGEQPAAGLTNFRGWLYGTTSLGGYSGSPCNSCGTVFRIDAKGREQVVHRFLGSPKGEYPMSNLTSAYGRLFGTTYSGSRCSGNCGTVYEVTGSDQVRILHSFAGGADGLNPKGGVITIGNGALYGTTWTGGSSSNGIVYEIDASHREHVLHTFGGSPNDGAEPVGDMVVLNGELYGVTEKGGKNNVGSVFEISPGGAESVLFSFSAFWGEYPVGLVAFDGTLYGATSAAGGFKRGTVFALKPNGALRVLYSFEGTPQGDGAYPAAPPIFVGKNLYGTTRGGGAYGNGTVYELRRSGTEAVLYSFAKAPDGVHPFAPLLYTNGMLYGTTLNGGAVRAAYGTVFRLLP